MSTAQGVAVRVLHGTRRVRRLRLTGLCLLFCVGLGGKPAPAQDAVPLRAADGLATAASYRDVYVNDSFEAADAIAKAQRLSASGRWREAVETLQGVADSAGDKLVRVSGDYYVNIRTHIAELVSSYPKAGIAAYRLLYERRTTEALTALGARPTLRELLSVFDRYFCTARAGALADTLGQMAIESGDLSLAEHVYRRTLTHHPDTETLAPRCRSMLAVIGAMRGESGGTESIPDDVVRWLGEDRTLRNVVAEIPNHFAPSADTGSPDDWPIFHGDASRNRGAVTGIDELGLWWRFEGFGKRNSGEASEVLSGTERDRSRHLSIQPVMDGGLIFAQRSREIVALNMTTGGTAWRFFGDEKESGGAGYVEEQPAAWDAVTVHDGRLYASLPGDAASYYSYESAIHPADIICLDSKTGRVVWRLDRQAIEEDFAEVIFDSSPLVGHGGVFVVGRRRRSFGFEDCYLYRFDTATGAMAYRSHLGSASTGTFGSRRPTRTIAAMHGGTVYVCTNLGTIAAVSAHSGAVRWLRLYQRHRDDDTGISRFVRDVRPWQFNPVLVSDGRLVVLPTDAANVFVVSADTGALIHSIPTDTLGRVATLLGVRGGVLCCAGRTVGCYDLARGEPLWTTPLPDDANLFGRGLWADDRLLVPTRTGLSTYRVSDGERSDQSWDTEGEGGNLVALGDRLVVAGVDRISVYVRRREIWKALRQRMAATPRDPVPAMELAEVALSNGEFSEAITVLDEAVRRADALEAPLGPALSRRLFDDVLLFVDRLSARSMLDVELVDKLFAHASQFPPDTAAHLRYRVRFAALYVSFDQSVRALRLYHQILRDRSLRDLRLTADRSDPKSAGAHAREQIAALIESDGRSIYASYEAEAMQWLRSAQETQGEDWFARIVTTFPNSTTAPLALIAHGELLAKRGRAEAAAERFAKAYHRYPKDVDRPTLLRNIADAYEDAGMEEHAYRWLTKAAREHPSARFAYEGRSTGFLEYRERLAGVRNKVEPSRPDLMVPLGDRFVRSFDDSASLLVPRFGIDPASSWRHVFVSAVGGIRAFEPRRDAEIWPKPAPARGSPSLLIATTDVAVFASKHEVFALDVFSGARRWTLGEFPERFGREDADWEDADAFRTHAVRGQRIVSLRDSGEMTAVDLDSGTILWRKTHRPVPFGRIRLSGPWVLYHVIQDDKPSVCLVDVETGSLIERIAVDEKRSLLRVFATLDKQLVVVTSQSISSFDPESHDRRWRVQTAGRIRRASLLVDVDALYYSDDGGRVKKISLEDGHHLWKSPRVLPRRDDDFQASLQGGSVILSSTTAISAVDAVTGLLLWEGTKPEGPRFLERIITDRYAVAVDVRGDDEESVAYFYDHRNASGLIPREGGATKLGHLRDVRTVLVADGALLIQTGSTIRGWRSR